MTVAGLVLAAGEGRRLGTPKALLRHDGRLLVERAVDVVRDAGCDPVVVVLGAAAEDVAAAADLGHAVVVVNDAWASGMGSSLRTGLAVLADLHVPAVAVVLVDQPEVSSAVVRRLVDRWSPQLGAAVASYDGQPRNPAVLSARVWPEVSTAAVGDLGARAWIRTHPDDVALVACDDLGSAVDVDTPRDLDRLSPEPAVKDPE